ncbi:ABC transporter permease subunit [Klugiella xanthotipulae]|uniref:ABC-2 family transporter n=1 Tax=Klugiella xanthotipulae TaxID=244735 RepID=A0A543I3T7_9MICO|nr:ABC transporter permease subunit [Klugiella xanthotipulae]TQM65263.1 ABC-2 family transporter [Klugiella xanthotipulae]
MMNRQRVRALIRKDWRELSRNKQATVPLLVLPLVFVIIIPTAIILLGNNPALLATVNGLQAFIDNLPVGITPDGYSTRQLIIYAVIVYFMAPFFLLIPVMVASIMASSSFVGEKERRTIEGLLYTPLTDRELVLGKVLVSVVPAVLLTWGSFLIYTLLVNVLGGPILGGMFFPTWTWAVIIIVLVPLVSFLATCLIVAVSGRSTSMQDAQGSAMLIVLPVIALVVGQATGLLLFDVSVALIVAAALLVVDVVVFVCVVGRFQRERIVTRL